MELTDQQLAQLAQLATVGLQTLAQQAGLAEIQAHLQAQQKAQQAAAAPVADQVEN